MKAEDVIASFKQSLQNPESQLAGVETILNTPDGGRVIRIGDQLQFVSPGYSTTDKVKIANIMREASAEGKTPRQLMESQFRQEMVKGRPFEAATLKMSQGFPFVGEYIPEAVGLVSPETRRGIESLQRATEEEYPVSSMAARTVGAVVPSLLVPQGLMSSPGGVLPQTLKGAGLAGAESAVSGFGAGEGGVGNRLEKGVKEGLLGAALGGALSGAVSVLTSGITNSKAQNKAVGEIANKLGISKEAAAVIGLQLRAGSNVDDAIAAIRRAGSQGMIADADEAASKLLDASIALGGEAATVGRSAVEGRVTGLSERLGSVMDETLGAAPVGRQTIADTIANRSQARRSVAYDTAYSQPIDDTSKAGMELESIFDRVPSRYLNKAIEDANDYMRAEGLVDRQIRATLADDGSVVFEEMPNVVQADYLKRALQDRAYGDLTDSFGRPTGMGVTLNKLSNDLRSALGRAVPEYDYAVRMGGNKIREAKAAELGNVLFNPKTTREEVLFALKGASKDEINAMRLGARNQIQLMMDNTKRYLSPGSSNADVMEAQKLVRELGSPASQQKIQLLLGGNEYKKFKTAFDELTAALELKARVAPNSATGSRLEIGQMVEDVTAPGVAGSMMRGDFSLSGKQLIQLFTGKTSEFDAQQRKNVLAEVASTLTGRRGRDAQEALRYIRRAMDGAALSSAQANFVNETLQRVLLPATTGPEKVQ